MKKLLIANRGEIALRIIRTCKRLGIKTVAVYSDLDLGAAHAQLADEAHRIGGESAEDSYLRSDLLLAVAKQAGADAVHPGYGFLSEDAKFAEAVEKADLSFVGPSAETMQLLGRKDRARALAESLEIPTPPGYQGENQEVTALLGAAKDLGFPLMIKAAAGGGGRGMRRIERADELKAALESSKREALRFFGNDTLFLERLITDARHIEVQVIGDSHGTILHLFERDCSIQRRFQKVIEEAPATDLPPEMLSKLRRYALLLAEKGKLKNAATFEFLVAADGSACWFLEANTRLQVEHPVTEAITGLDLVELQLRVAAGESLGLKQDDVQQNGFAVEARIYAEVPEGDSFLPTSGQIRAWSPSHLARMDHALYPGLELHTEYDPLLAKVITTGKDRREARENLLQALHSTRLAGVGNNISYLSEILKILLAADATPRTDFIEQHHQILLSSSDAKMFYHHLAVTYLFYEQLQDKESLEDTFELLRRAAPRQARELAIKSDVPGGAHLEHISAQCLERHANGCSGVFTSSEKTTGFSIRRAEESNSYFVQVGTSNEVQLTIVEQRLSASAQPILYLAVSGHAFEVAPKEENPSGGALSTPTENELRASLPGTVVRVSVAAGEQVVEGQALVILESMKMEHKVSAPRGAIVETVSVEQGASVRTGDLLITLRPSKKS